MVIMVDKRPRPRGCALGLWRLSAIIPRYRTLTITYSSRKAGSMYYNYCSVVSGKAVELIYKLLAALDCREVSTGSLEYVHNLVSNQATLFAKSADFDYRSVFVESADSEGELGKQFDSELMAVVDTITKSNRSSRTQESSDMHCSNRRRKSMMVCAILANMMDGRSTFLQTLIGLVCYGQGLRDKGMKFLNAFGVSCSVFHVRKHGSFWANARKAIEEISPVAFWRATFDNLDFRLN